MRFDNLNIPGVGAINCVDVMPGGGAPGPGQTDAVGQRVTEALTCLAPPRVVFPLAYYDSGSQWQAFTASYLPGSEVVSVNGIAQFGHWEETDPARGIITLHVEVLTTDTVTMSYLANGALS